MVAGLVFAVMVSLLAGTLISSYFAVLAQNRADRLEQATKDAQEQGLIALETLLIEIDNRLYEVPQAREVRGAILNDVIQSLDRIVDGGLGRANVDTAAVFIKLGIIFNSVGDANNTGAHEAAMKYFRAAERILLRLNRAEPDHVVALRILTQVTVRIARDYIDREEFAFAEPELVKAVALADRLIQQAPDDTYCLIEVASVYQEWGYHLLDGGRPTDAEQAYLIARDASSKALSIEPEDYHIQDVHVSSLGHLGDYYF